MASGSPSLRARQRQIVLDTVLDIALARFAAAGYQQTTMQSIADDARIGIATLFRHFRNKASILAGLVKRDLDALFAQGEKLIADPPQNSRDGVIAYCLLMLELLDMSSKSITLKPGVWPSIPTGREEIDAVVRFADIAFRRQIVQLLEHYRAAGDLAPGVDLDDLSMAIFYIYNGHYLDYVCGAIKSKTELKTALKRRLILVLPLRACPPAE